MRTAVTVALALALAACRGEPAPRDYQNNPPAMTHPVSNSSQSPANQGMPGPKPESTAAEGPTTQPVTQTAPTTLPDQAPTTTTSTTTTVSTTTR